MEIQVEKILQDLGLEVYMRRRLEEEKITLITQIKKKDEEIEIIQKSLKKQVEDV